jgi:hypothetical protein
MQLLTTGRVAVFLDGLDEIPEPQRPSALHALAQQATFRLVLLTRTHELAIAAEHHVLTGAAALELQPLTPDDAATYLQHNLPDPPPEPWQRLLDVLTQDTDTPLTQTLNNPLTITLLRDTYQPPPTPNSAIGTIDDLIDTSRFPTSDHITNHLLDHAITTAYMPRPGQPLPPYTPQTAHRTLTVIAQHLRAHQTHDLAWWRIPTWVPRTPRTLLIVVITGLLIGLVVGLPLGLSTGLVGGLGGGLLAGLIRGLPKKLVVSTEPHRLGRFQRKRAVWGALSNGLVFGLVGRLVFGLMGGLVFGLVGGVGGVLLEGFRANATGTITQPNDLRRGEIVYWLALGLVLGGGGGLSSALLSGAGHGMEALVIGVAVAPVVGLVVGVTLSVTWLVAVSQIYLTIRYHTPMRLARFLTDAHNRHLLRTVGPIYQFRHATLQERLAPPMVAAK